MKKIFTKNFVPILVPPYLREEIYKQREQFIRKNNGIQITKKKFIELKVIPILEEAMLKRRVYAKIKRK